MELLFSLLVGGLYAAGLYMMMRRSIVKILIGISLLGHAANLLIFSASGLVMGAPPIIPAGETTLTESHADPLPQALILTAIVIGFGVQAFALALIKRVCDAAGTDDLDAAESHAAEAELKAAGAAPAREA